MQVINQSNQNIQNDQQQFEEQINPSNTPIITQNVPFVVKSKDISNIYIIINITFNISQLLMLVLLPLYGLNKSGMFVLIAIVISLYIIYLISVYYYSTLTSLLNLRSHHEYQHIYNQLLTAQCKMIFRFTPSKNRIDQIVINRVEQYKNIKCKDRSGKIYGLSKLHDIKIVNYKKKYYFRSKQIKTRITKQFQKFIQKQKQKTDPQEIKIIKYKAKIDFQIQNIQQQIGFYMNQNNKYKIWFLTTIILGLAIYYQKLMKNKIIRYQIDIVKQIY